MRQNTPGSDRADLGGSSVESLIIAIGEGDQAAFEELYRRSSAKLLGVSLRVVGNRADAEEVLHDCFIRLWRNAGQYEPSRGSGTAWLTMLVRNGAVDRLRSTTSRAGAVDRDAEARMAMDALPADPIADLALAECVARLGDRDGAYIRSAFYAGKTYVELAEEAELPIGTVKSSIRRALIRLRECLR